MTVLMMMVGVVCFTFTEYLLHSSEAAEKLEDNND